MVTSGTLWIRYWNGGRKCKPPRSSSGWKPASPFSAMMPLVTEPAGSKLLDDADAVVGDVAERERQHRQREQPEHNPEYERHGYSESHDSQSFQIVWECVRPRSIRPLQRYGGEM